MNAASKITYEAFTQRVAERADVSEAEADAYIHQLARTTGEALENGEDVQFHRFGRFRTTHVDERSGQNPNTGEALRVEEHSRVDFQPYKALLVAVNWPFRNLRTRMLPDHEDDTRTSALPWLLLALALFALLAGLGLYTWLSGPDEATPAPAAAPAATATEQPAIEPTSAATTPEGGSESDTATGSGTETTPEPAPTTATGTAADAQAAEAGTAPAQTAAAPTTVVVAPGDTLWAIARSQWGDTSWWPLLYAENRADLPARNPDRIEAGTSLRIPELAGSPARPTEADRSRKEDAYRTVTGDYQKLGDPRALAYQRFVDGGF